MVPFWNPKILEKSQFFEKIEIRRPPLKQYRFEAAFRMDFKALRAQFSWILEPLDDVFGLPRPVSRNMRGACQVADLTLMIRATRGRSIGWIGGWVDG